MYDSYRWGNHTALNMTPRNPQDLTGLSATNTVPVQVGNAHACTFPGGHAALNNISIQIETDPTPLDPLHFLIVLPFFPWRLTMAQWAASRANVNNGNPATWLPPTTALYNLSQLFFVTVGRAAPAAAEPPFAGVPQVRRARVQLLWHVDYQDGPLSGVALFEGRYHWFAVANAQAEVRAALLYPLDADEWQTELEEHRRFQRFVGRHTDYDALGRRKVGDVLPTEAWPRFFDEPGTASRGGNERAYTARSAIAWFEI